MEPTSTPLRSDDRRKIILIDEVEYVDGDSCRSCGEKLARVWADEKRWRVPAYECQNESCGENIKMRRFDEDEI